MKSAIFIGKARTSSGYSLYTNHELWPYMIEDFEGCGVKGELFKVDRETLEKMYDRKCDLNDRFWLSEVVIDGRDIYNNESVYSFFHTFPEHGKIVESGEYTNPTLKLKE